MIKLVRDEVAESLIRELITQLGISYIKPEGIRVVRSCTDAKVYARIWGLSRVLQVGLGTGPVYVIEINDEKFLKLSCKEKIDVILHELAHIPRTFSGYIRQHTNAFYKDLRKFRKMVKSVDADLVSRICSHFRP